jgi:trehalose utilization protein
MKRLLLPFAAALVIASLGLPAMAADSPAPLRVLLITGGCCHDYAKQKDILKAELEKRANVVVDQIHTDDKSTKPPLAILGNPEYAKGYDLVIHDECAADIKDPAIVEGVLKPHRDGIPGVNLHCAMHCYRVGNPGTPQKAGTPEALWFEYLGIQSSAHGAQLPIEITYVAKDNPIAKGLSDWKTINEELYNNIQVFPTATPLAKGKQISKQKDGTDKESEYVVAWTNTYNGKTRVFNTTIGHNNETVADARYMDLVTHGVLWACDKLKDDGTPKDGYGPKK